MSQILQTTLLQGRLDELGWNVPRLHRELHDAGACVSLESVRLWVANGRGMSDRNKLKLCVLLGISVEALVRARVAQDDFKAAKRASPSAGAKLLAS